MNIPREPRIGRDFTKQSVSIGLQRKFRSRQRFFLWRHRYGHESVDGFHLVGEAYINKQGIRSLGMNSQGHATSILGWCKFWNSLLLPLPGLIEDAEDSPVPNRHCTSIPMTQANDVRQRDRFGPLTVH